MNEDWDYVTEQKMFAWADRNDDLGWSDPSAGHHTFRSVYHTGLVNGAKYGYREFRFKPRFEWVRDEDGNLICRYNDSITLEVKTLKNGETHYKVSVGAHLMFGREYTEESTQTAAETRLIELITPKA